MSNVVNSFGRNALQASSVEGLIELERQKDRLARFARLDSLISDLLIRSLRGDRILTMTENDIYESSVSIDGLTSEQRKFISDSFGLDQQQSRGAWFIPEKISLAGGTANFGFFLTQGFRFPHSLASLERGKVLLRSSPDAIFFWAVLGPMFERLLQPFDLRARLSGTLSSEESQTAWKEAKLLFDSLGFSYALERSTLSRNWKVLSDSTAQLQAKQEFLRTLSGCAYQNVGTRYRLSCLVPLLSQYYKKVKADGRAQRKQVLTKAFQPILSGFFEGDWLALLDYLGEQPHADEQIVTALPKTPLRVKGISRAEEIAAKQGIPAEEVQKIAAALWQDSRGTSPVEARIAALKNFWAAFDEIHTKQRPGMKPLWGLIEETGFIAFERNNESPYQSGLYRELVPADLIHEIEILWGSIMLTKWPDRIVTEPFPHRLMAETFGPALAFWQSCALTAWFICEGPYSRTDMAGLAHHQRRELHNLREMNAPIDEKLFEELIEGEKRLGPEEAITRDSETTEVGYGFSITVSMNAGSRRKGFEILRDIITRYRRSWANEYLDTYLRACWEVEIKEAAKSFYILLGEKGGKSPTLKQFAKSAVLATNHWFAGDVSGLYRTIGEKAPAQPTRSVLLPADKEAFVRRVFEQLPSRQFEMYDGRVSDDASQVYYRKELAELAIKYVQLEEALGEPPEMKQLGDKFTYRSRVLHSDDAEAWKIFSRAVKDGKSSVQDSRPTKLSKQPSGPDQLASPKTDLSSSTTSFRETSFERSSEKPSWIQRIFGKKGS
jgi:hypothetical protein